MTGWKLTQAVGWKGAPVLRKDVDLMREGLVFLLDGFDYFKIGKLDLDPGGAGGVRGRRHGPERSR